MELLALTLGLWLLLVVARYRASVATQIEFYRVGAIVLTIIWVAGSSLLVGRAALWAMPAAALGVIESIRGLLILYAFPTAH